MDRLADFILSLSLSLSLSQIHWFSIFNSFMMVIFLVGLVSMILLRTLRKDYVRYNKDEEATDVVSIKVIKLLLIATIII